MKDKINKHFVSEIDQFLAEFDRKTPRSASQQAELAKYNRVAQRRDNPENTTTS
jgi:hypothetical protein